MHKTICLLSSKEQQNFTLYILFDCSKWLQNRILNTRSKWLTRNWEKSIPKINMLNDSRTIALLTMNWSRSKSENHVPNTTLSEYLTLNLNKIFSSWKKVQEFEMMISPSIYWMTFKLCIKHQMVNMSLYCHHKFNIILISFNHE